MPVSVELNRNSGWVGLGGMRVRAPGITGSLVWRPPAERAALVARAISANVAEAASDPIEQALQEAGLEDQGSLSIPAGTASLTSQPNQMAFDRQIDQNRVEFAIYRDESGVISLHLPYASPPTPDTQAAAHVVQTSRRVRYTIPMRHAGTPAGGVPRV